MLEFGEFGPAGADKIGDSSARHSTLRKGTKVGYPRVCIEDIEGSQYSLLYREYFTLLNAPNLAGHELIA